MNGLGSTWGHAAAGSGVSIGAGICQEGRVEGTDTIRML